MNEATREYVEQLVADAPSLSPERPERICRIFAAALSPVKDRPERKSAVTKSTSGGVVESTPTEQAACACHGTGHVVRVFLTAQEAATALRFSPGDTGTAGAQRVYKLIKKGELRSVRLGRVLRIPVSEIERLA